MKLDTQPLNTLSDAEIAAKLGVSVELCTAALAECRQRRAGSGVRFAANSAGARTASVYLHAATVLEIFNLSIGVMVSAFVSGPNGLVCRFLVEDTVRDENREELADLGRRLTFEAVPLSGLANALAARMAPLYAKLEQTAHY